MPDLSIHDLTDAQERIEALRHIRALAVGAGWGTYSARSIEEWAQLPGISDADVFLLMWLCDSRRAARVLAQLLQNALPHQVDPRISRVCEILVAPSWEPPACAVYRRAAFAAKTDAEDAVRLPDADRNTFRVAILATVAFLAATAICPGESRVLPPLLVYAAIKELKLCYPQEGGQEPLRTVMCIYWRHPV